MSCYAAVLGDCEGKLEREHFIPIAVQKLLGRASITGLPWQGDRKFDSMAPGSYAFGKVLCSHHHDLLDGLDGIARDYFRNMVELTKTPEARDASLLAGKIDGRKLERWFLKTICGAISSGNVVADRRLLPERWVRVLFGLEAWPDEWRFSMRSQDGPLQLTDAQLQLNFYWTDSKELLALEVRGHGLSSWLCLVPPDLTAPETLVRPTSVGMDNISGCGTYRFSTRIDFAWPRDATVDF